MAVQWCDPPRARQQDWLHVLEETMTRPGVWAMLRDYDHASSAHSAKQHLRKRHNPAGRWEFQSGQIIDSSPPRWGVWAKWEPEP